VTPGAAVVVTGRIGIFTSNASASTRT
jgi:hypothetical protein